MATHTSITYHDTDLWPFSHLEGKITPEKYHTLLHGLHTELCESLPSLPAEHDTTHILSELRTFMRQAPKASAGSESIPKKYTSLLQRDCHKQILSPSVLVQIHEVLQTSIFQQLQSMIPDMTPEDCEFDRNEGELLYYEDHGEFSPKREIYCDRTQLWRPFYCLLTLDSSFDPFLINDISRGLSRLYLPTSECRQYFSTRTPTTPRKYDFLVEQERQLLSHDCLSTMRPGHFLLHDCQALHQSLSVGDNGFKVVLKMIIWIRGTPSMKQTILPCTCIQCQPLPLAIQMHQMWCPNQGTTTGMYQCLDWLQAHVPKPIERLILQFSQSSDTLRQKICNCPLELNNQNHSKHSKHKTRYCVCSCEHCCHNERCQQDNINGRNQLYLGNSQYERPSGWS